MDPIIDVNGFGFTNNGNVPIYALNLRLTTGGSSDIVYIEPDEGGLVGPGFSTILNYDYDYYDEIDIIPVLLGETKDGEVKEKPCDEMYTLQIK